MNAKPLFMGMRARGFRRTGAVLLTMAFLVGMPVDALVHRSCAHHDAPVGAADYPASPDARAPEGTGDGALAARIVHAAPDAHAAHEPGPRAPHHPEGHTALDPDAPDALPLHGTEEHDPTEHGPCTCLGACQSATATVAAAGSRSSDLAIGEGWRVVTPPVEMLVVTRDLARLLPFANGPPHAV